MILEPLGKFCFSKIHPLFFYFFLLCPILFGAGYAFIEYTNVSDLEERFYHACKKGKTALKRKSEKERLMKRYANTNPYFLDEQIESLSFLQKEQKELETLSQHPALAEKRGVESRLNFLKSSSNRLAFTEEAIRTSASMKETEEKQKHPVQMDEKDVKKLLALMEDVTIDSFPSPNHRPQIVITDFRMEEKQTPLKTNIFEVEMQFIKREFIR